MSVIHTRIDEVFKTTTPLAAGASVTSDWFETTGYDKIVGSCFADQDGTLYIEQSPDGSNPDYEESTSYTANDKLGFIHELVCKYVRIRFVNGATAQTEFRLYVNLKT
jgi:hypothetical protein